MNVLVSHSVHLIAHVFLSIFGPKRGFRHTRQFAKHMRLDPYGARHVAALLEPYGTCLTRAIAVAARLPNSTVVLGGMVEERLHAHAWVEVGGRPLRSWDSCGEPIARLEA